MDYPPPSFTTAEMRGLPARRRYAIAYAQIRMRFGRMAFWHDHDIPKLNGLGRAMIPVVGEDVWRAAAETFLTKRRPMGKDRWRRLWELGWKCGICRASYRRRQSAKQKYHEGRDDTWVAEWQLNPTCPNSSYSVQRYQNSRESFIRQARLFFPRHFPEPPMIRVEKPVISGREPGEVKRLPAVKTAS